MCTMWFLSCRGWRYEGGNLCKFWKHDHCVHAMFYFFLLLNAEYVMWFIILFLY